MPRPAAWCEHELEQVRAEKQALQTEIERLRTLNDSMQAESDERGAHLHAVLAHVVELRAEIERLKVEAALWENRTREGSEIIMANVAEIERLTQGQREPKP